MKSFKSILSLLILLGSSSLVASAQKTIISGHISTNDGKAASQVSIRIEGKNWGDISDINGNYQIDIPTAGKYVLHLTALGILDQVKDVIINKGEHIKANFEIELTYDQLADVTVLSNQNQLGNKITYGVAKMPLKNLENPQVYSSVGADLMLQQGITNFDDAMRNVPGISRTWASTGRAGDGATYFALRGFEAQPSLYNSLPGFTAGDLDPANIEEIQVLKGPSGTLYGANFVGYGGVINVITKKPYFEKGGMLSYTGGSFGLSQLTADYNTPINDSMAFRMVADYHTENSFQDAGFKKSFLLAPSFTYSASQRLSFDFMAEIYHEERATAPVFFNTNRADPLSFKNIEELALNPDLSFTSNDLTIKNPRFNIQAQMNYKISGVWSSQTAISRSVSWADGYYGYIYGNDLGSNQFEQDITKENQSNRVFDVQQNFNADFKIGSIRNRLLIGLDYFSQQIVNNGSGYAAVRLVTPEGDVIQYDDNHPVYMTTASIDSLLASAGNSISNTSKQTYAAYVSDVINFTPKLSAMLSLRADYFDNKGEKSDKSDDFDQFALSPKFGLVYQPVLDKVSLFANYQNSFMNVAPQTVMDVDGKNPRIKTFTPEHANQWEVGIKTNIIQNKLAFTASYYDIRVENRVTPLADNINDYDQRGKVRSRGVDIDIKADPTAGLTLIAGYSHNKIENMSSNNTDFYTEKGRAPGGQGPQDLANFWGTYTFQRGKLQNFGFGIGGNYAGIYKVIDNSETGVFDLPSYTLLNATLYYNGQHVRVSLNGNNLLNKQYYIGYWSVNPQPPVNYSMTVAFKL
jgi:iron complex outermembrane receptor protein